MENTNKCPFCPNHCDRNNLQCGKGEDYFNGEAVPHSEGMRHGYHSGKHRGHRRPEYPTGSLADLLAKCGHRLFHGGDETMFTVLNQEESAELKKLLNKLLSS